MSIDSKIVALYPEYSRNSLLERALDRVKASATPEADLEVLRRFTVTMPEEDFFLFSGIDVAVDRRIRVAAVGPEYWEELQDVYPLFDDPNVQVVCLRANGQVAVERLGADLEVVEGMVFPRRSFDILVQACGHRVKGMKPLVITDAETGLKINFVANGFRKDPVPAVVVRRPVAV